MEGCKFCFPAEDQFIKKCRCIMEKIQEETLEIQGEFLTEADMKEKGFPEHLDLSYI